MTTTANQALYRHDLETTAANRVRLKKNRNLIYWYQQLYRDVFSFDPEIAKRRILEIGSGTSPLRMFLPNVVTSDVLELEYVDIVFDCHVISELAQIPDRSLDVITLTNVLHHLRDPLHFLKSATQKLSKGGRLILVEPYFSLISYQLYKALHHEPVDFNIERPVLNSVDGPLSSSNQAIPYMIFFSRPDWMNELSEVYDLKNTSFGFHTSLAYMATGGISRILPIPGWIYRPFFKLDRFLARTFPKVFASFFSARLVTAS